MSADAVLTATLLLPALATGIAHAIVWFFWPEAR